MSNLNPFPDILKQARFPVAIFLGTGNPEQAVRIRPSVLVISYSFPVVQARRNALWKKSRDLLGRQDGFFARGPRWVFWMGPNLGDTPPVDAEKSVNEVVTELLEKT